MADVATPMPPPLQQDGPTAPPWWAVGSHSLKRKKLPPDEMADIDQVPTSLNAVLDNLERDHEFLTVGATGRPAASGGQAPAVAERDAPECSPRCRHEPGVLVTDQHLHARHATLL